MSKAISSLERKVTPGALKPYYYVPVANLGKSRWRLFRKRAPAPVQRRRPAIVANVPVRGEDPQLIDRCLWSLANQTYPPTIIRVCESSQRTDYAKLRSHWTGSKGSTLVAWEFRRDCPAFSSLESRSIVVSAKTVLECRALERSV